MWKLFTFVYGVFLYRIYVMVGQGMLSLMYFVKSIKNLINLLVENAFQMCVWDRNLSYGLATVLYEV